MTPDPQTAWSAYCLIDEHERCEQPDQCGCDCHHTAVDDDHTWGSSEEQS